jgi:hypothetical protein
VEALKLRARIALVTFLRVGRYTDTTPNRQRRHPCTERGSKRVDVDTFEMCNALRISQAPCGLVSTQHQQFVSQSSQNKCLRGHQTDRFWAAGAARVGDFQRRTLFALEITMQVPAIFPQTLPLILTFRPLKKFPYERISIRLRNTFRLFCYLHINRFHTFRCPRRVPRLWTSGENATRF